MSRHIDVDELVSNLKKLENEYSYADGNDKYAFVYGALTGVRQAIIYAKAAPTVKDEWISVEDRLPNKEGTYLTYTDKDKMLMDVFCIYPSHGTKFWVGGNGKVTHWMPLPAPPKD